MDKTAVYLLPRVAVGALVFPVDAGAWFEFSKVNIFDVIRSIETWL